MGKRKCGECGIEVEVDEIPGVFTFDIVFCSVEHSKAFWERDAKLRAERGLPPLQEVKMGEEDTSTWKCEVCGCTDLTPCPGGCAWVRKNLCSNCSDIALDPNKRVPLRILNKYIDLGLCWDGRVRDKNGQIIDPKLLPKVR